MAKKSKKVCKQCGSKLEITYDGVEALYPVYSCEIHGVIENHWEKWFSNYNKKWQKKENWDKPVDKVSCIIGYFCNFYEKFYGYKYTLENYNPIPFKSKSFIMSRRLLTMFDGNAHDVRVFIRWVFAKKVKTTKYPVTSLGFFVNSAFVNEYNHAKRQSMVLKRYTPLPNDFIDWCSDKYPEIFEKQDLKTWNDLNGLITYIKSYGGDTMEEKVLIEAVNRKMLLDTKTYRKLED